MDKKIYWLAGIVGVLVLLTPAPVRKRIKRATTSARKAVKSSATRVKRSTARVKAGVRKTKAQIRAQRILNLQKARRVLKRKRKK